MVTLRPHQKEVLERLSNGKILWGGVGSGKSITAVAYYAEKDMCGDLYVITTAKKRNSLDWEADAAKFGIGTSVDATVGGVLHVDSWNNLFKYVDIKGSFFIFDEQRLVGNGTWVKSFYKIARNNAWLILSATPGDTWLDYVPVFVANGFYKNLTQFRREHVVYEPFSRYPKIKRFLGVNKLNALKKEVLVEMPYVSQSVRQYQDVRVYYNLELFKKVQKERWNVYTDRPIKNFAELFAVLKKIVYSDRSRLDQIRGLMDRHPKLIVWYNFNYELDILRELYDDKADLVEIAEYNGQQHDPIPKSDNWVYLVQYTAGSEAWNCTETDAMIFYSLPYSYKKYMQAQGRIDRLNSPYTTLYYYNLMSNSIIDRAVRRSLDQKQSFNESKWVDEHMPIWEDE